MDVNINQAGLTCPRKCLREDVCMRNENWTVIFGVFPGYSFPLLLWQNHLGLSTTRNNIDMTERWITALINQQGSFSFSEGFSSLFHSERRNDMRVNNRALQYWIAWNCLNTLNKFYMSQSKYFSRSPENVLY